MNILFLDDDPTRAQIYVRENPDVLWVETADDCIKQLEFQRWEFVSLDHDLGGEQFVSSDGDNTGMAVVRWIEENHPDVGGFHIHSWNIPAADVMKQRIRAAGYLVTQKPFS